MVPTKPAGLTDPGAYWNADPAALLAQLNASPDGITWSALPGSGKSRDLTGKSGTSIWVRFALQVRQQQSAWSEPVHITFP